MAAIPASHYGKEWKSAFQGLDLWPSLRVLPLIQYGYSHFFLQVSLFIILIP